MYGMELARTWLFMLITTLSPFVKFSTGIGHSPLIPMTGLSIWPSGLRFTQVMLKSCVTVADVARPASAAMAATVRAMVLLVYCTASSWM